MVCKCFEVTESKILEAMEKNGLKTVQDITNYTKAGGGCGKCKGEIEKIVKDYWNKTQKKDFSTRTMVEKIKYIEKVLNENVNPKLKQDGGWIELLDLNGSVVKVRFLGMCSGCPSSAITLKNVVEKKLKEKVDKSLTVVAE